MGQLLHRLVTFAIEIESTPGTPETLVDADGGMVVSEIEYVPNIEQVPRDFLTGDFSPFASQPGKRSGQFRFVTEMKGSGTAGTVPTLDKALRACGFGETPIPATSNTYNPISTSIPHATIAVWRTDASGNSTRELISGAQGNVIISITVGGFVRMEFDFLGRFETIADDTPINPTLDVAKPPLVLGIPFTIGGYSAKPNTITINMQNQIIPPVDMSHASGHGPSQFTGRTPIINADIQAVRITDKDYFSSLVNGTEEAMVLGPVGTVAGNRFTITAPKLQVTGLPGGERDQGRIFNMSGQFNRNSGEDEVSLLFN